MADFGQGLAQQGLKAIAPEAALEVAAIDKVVAAINEWVAALNPAIANELNHAFKDLEATLGIGFVEAVTMVTGVVRQVAGIILPLMQQLIPVVNALVQSWMNNLIPTVQALVDIVEALIPVCEVLAVVMEAIQAVTQPLLGVIQILAVVIGGVFKLLELALSPVLLILKLFSEAMDGVTEIFHLISVVLKTVIQTVEAFVKSLFAGIGIKNVIEFLHNVIMNVISAMLQLVAFMAKAFGADDFLKNLIENLKKEGQGGATAAEPGQYKSFEEVNKQINLSAGQAAMGGTAKKYDLSDVIESLKGIQTGNSKLGEIATDVAKIVGFLNAPVSTTMNGIAHAAADSNTWRRAARGDGWWSVVNPVGAGVSSIWD